jgi:hypothetical protein
VKEWLQQDADQASKQQIEQLAEAEDADALQELLGQRLQFGEMGVWVAAVARCICWPLRLRLHAHSALLGLAPAGTAGLRGLMGPGYNRMNAVTVQQTTQGLLRYLRQQQPERLARGGIAVGYDGRHGSRRFAHIVAACALAEGVPAWLFSELVPTPFVPAAVEQLVRRCGGGGVALRFWDRAGGGLRGQRAPPWRAAHSPAAGQGACAPHFRCESRPLLWVPPSPCRAAPPV